MDNHVHLLLQENEDIGTSVKRVFKTSATNPLSSRDESKRTGSISALISRRRRYSCLYISR